MATLLGALVALASVLPAVAPETATAAGQDPALRDLWQQYPLDADGGGAGDRAGRTAPPATQAHDRGGEAPPLQRSGEASDAANRLVTSLQLAIGAVAVALVVVAGAAALAYPGHAPFARRTRRARRWAVSAGLPDTPVAPAGTVAGIPAPAPPPRTPEQVVDDLIRALPPIPPQQALAGQEPAAAEESEAAPEQPDALEPVEPEPTDAGVSKAKPARPLPRKRTPKPKLGAVEPAADPADAIRAKRERRRAVHASVPGDGDDPALKEKLAATSMEEAVAAPTVPVRRSRQTRGTEGVRPTRVLRPVPSVESERPARGGVAHEAAGATADCEIRWWHGPVTSWFRAVTRKPNGQEVTFAISPSFRWEEDESKQESGVVADALANLVASLERSGWTVVGHGEEWFSVRLRAPTNPTLGQDATADD